MAQARHPYAGRAAVIATMHRKEKAVAPTFRSMLGVIITAAPGLDTDQLGTFSGEIPRVGTMRDVAIRKARLGMNAAGAPLGLASEGSFGPHPATPFIPAGMELLVFVDDERGIVVGESLIAEKTNYDHLVISLGEAIDEFLLRIGFPDHGLIVRPNQGEAASALAKGIVDPDSLRRAIETAAAVSPDGRARLETDMRAHFNPTRMKSIAMLAERLARRLEQLCPACGAPGFGRTGSRAGLPCEACGAPTEMIVAEILGCPACDYTEERARTDGLKRASSQHCPLCNP